MGAQYHHDGPPTSSMQLPPSSEALSELENMRDIITQPQSFRYLDDSILSNDNTSRDYSKEYILHICMFRVNHEIGTPFLEYYFQSHEESYALPHESLDMAPFINITSFNDNDDDDDDDNDALDASSREFLKQCSQHVEKTLGYVPDNLNEMYRGFLENNNHVYAFFDFTNKSFNKQTGGEVILEGSAVDDNGTVAIMDEIIHKKAILGKPIEEDCVAVFILNPFVQTMKDANRNLIASPSVGYLCQHNENQEYENVYNEDKIAQTESISFPSIDHEDYGSIFVVSLEPLNQEYSGIVRVASFIDTEELFDNTADEEDEDEDEKGFCFQNEDTKLCASYNIGSFYPISL